MLSIKNLSKSFNDKTILNNISLELEAGKIALLLGGSGTGKSTLLRILNGLESADSGTIILDGQPLDIDKIHKTHVIGLVFQQFNLFEHLSVIDNITLALEKVLGHTSDAARKRAQELLDRFGLKGKEDMPISRLSGGQKQRLAIARTLALNPKIVCLDEPTSALDPRLTKTVADTITTLAHQGYSVIVATHDMALIEYLKCAVYLLENGSIIEQATSEELRLNPEKFKHLQSFMRGLEAEQV